MTGEEQAAIVEEIIALHCRDRPQTAKKMRVMYRHLAHVVIPDDPHPDMLRAMLAASVDLIDKFVLVDGEFNEGQRAVLAAEAMQTVDKFHQDQKQQTRH